MSKLHLTISILTATVFLVCSPNPSEGLPKVYEEFTEAQHFDVPEPGVRIFTDNEAWLDLYDQYWNSYDNSGKTDPPEVDFESEMVIGIFWGTQNQGCYDWVNCIEVVFIRPGVIKVYLGPLPNLGNCDAIAHPLQIIKVRMTDMQVDFYGDVPG